MISLGAVWAPISSDRPGICGVRPGLCQPLIQRPLGHCRALETGNDFGLTGRLALVFCRIF